MASFTSLHTQIHVLDMFRFPKFSSIKIILQFKENLTPLLITEVITINKIH